MRETPAAAAFAIAPPPGDAGDAPADALIHVLRRVWRDRAGRAAILGLLALALLVLLGPLLWPWDPRVQLDIVRLQSRPPSWQHWFGTDVYSRDLLARLLDGGRVSLAIALVSATLAAAIGAAWGAIAGYAGGRVDGWLMRTVDVCLAVPRVLLLLAVIALWGRVSAGALIVLLGTTGWFGVSRIARGAALAARRSDFVAAARALGAGRVRIFVRHVLPATFPQVLVNAALAMGQVIVLEAGLSYLGLGVQQPFASWGNIISDGRETIATTWWLTLFPGLALVGTALALNTLADRLREALNPRQLPAP
jgi:peptide/nickel transport system permease protein